MEHNETRTAALETPRGLEIMTVLADTGTGGAESEMAINACCEGGTRQISQGQQLSRSDEERHSVLETQPSSHAGRVKRHGGFGCERSGGQIAGQEGKRCADTSLRVSNYWVGSFGIVIQS